MAGTTLKRRKDRAPLGSIGRDLVIQLNAAIADVELIRAAVVATCVKLDLDGGGGGVIGTDYEAQATVAAISPAGDLTAAKIGDEGGTVISA